jgi:1,4-alpha-glucan branching enzyme
MGGEFGQWREWTETQSLDWHLLEEPFHKGVQLLVGDLNRFYGSADCLWSMDGEPAGFQWIDPDNAAENIVSFIRRSPQSGRELVCVGNFSPLVRAGHRLGLPRRGEYKLVINTDAAVYGGTGLEIAQTITSEEIPFREQSYSATLTLPPLATIWFNAPDPVGVNS